MAMIKENKKPRGKIKTMTLSVILAILIWAAVIYINPPEMTTTISNLPVRIIGEETLRDRGLAVVGRNGILGLSVSVKGKRSDLLKLSGGIYVDVDVSDISRAGEYDFNGTVSLPSAKLTLDGAKFSYVPLRIEEVTSKEVPLRTETVGKNDAYITEAIPETSAINIDGAKSEVDSISYALLSIDTSDMTEDITVEEKYVYMNEENIPLNALETVRADISSVNVLCKLYHAVSVNVVPVLAESLKSGYILDTEKTAVSPQSIVIGVYDDDEAVSKTQVNALITEIKDEVSATIKEEDGIYIPLQHRTVAIRPVADKISKKPITVNVSAHNVLPGLNVKINPVTVEALGAERELIPENIHASVNLSGMTQGEYSVEVSLSSDVLRFEGKYYAEVIIS